MAGEEPAIFLIPTKLQNSEMNFHVLVILPDYHAA
jgi:hypothetical protein